MQCCSYDSGPKPRCMIRLPGGSNDNKYGDQKKEIWTREEVAASRIVQTDCERHELRAPTLRRPATSDAETGTSNLSDQHCLRIASCIRQRCALNSVSFRAVTAAVSSSEQHRPIRGTELDTLER